jgi:catechol 2,3-dioxygenase-like lactoylglutathione lyase family enzyme
MRIQFIASMAAVVADPAPARRLFGDALGLNFEGAVEDYVFTEKLDGAKHFGLWPLKHAAQACFGRDAWPAELPVPHACIEFEVASAGEVKEAAAELEGRGYRLLHPAKTEPWGQTLTRLMTPEGLIVGVCYTPHMHGS